MATRATTISTANLAKLTQAAVKAAGGKGTIIKGPIWGFILAELDAANQLKLATAVTTQLAVGAKAAGITGLKAHAIGNYEARQDHLRVHRA